MRAAPMHRAPSRTGCPRSCAGRGRARWARSGASHVTGIALHLRGEVRAIFMDWLRAYRPDLVERYEALYARSAYAPKAEQERLTAMTRKAGRGRRDAPRGRRATGHEAALKTRTREPEQTRPRQESLF